MSSSQDGFLVEHQPEDGPRPVFRKPYGYRLGKVVMELLKIAAADTVGDENSDIPAAILCNICDSASFTNMLQISKDDKEKLERVTHMMTSIVSTGQRGTLISIICPRCTRSHLLRSRDSHEELVRIHDNIERINAETQGVFSRAFVVVLQPVERVVVMGELMKTFRWVQEP